MVHRSSLHKRTLLGLYCVEEVLRVMDLEEKCKLLLMNQSSHTAIVV